MNKGLQIKVIMTRNNPHSQAAIIALGAAPWLLFDMNNVALQAALPCSAPTRIAPSKTHTPQEEMQSFKSIMYSTNKYNFNF